MSEQLELNDLFRWNGVKTILSERSEFIVLAKDATLQSLNYFQNSAGFLAEILKI
ncbi:hypothetical protein JHL18_06665 [Clostridium sp. YIM B02505]|uniref:Uncharacterized protein n=1 Tax=Clostridium yunnanense TaxID=2800325 RepID=A0ABS1ELV2_9CLOT|nr:hypothetical protein [Clostridium yunnanense]MBK1810314.1 hypothetical protein [Clostridium yunnanense]